MLSCIILEEMYQIQSFEVHPEPDMAGYPSAYVAGIGTRNG